MNKLLEEQGEAAGRHRRGAAAGSSSASSRSRRTRCACRRGTRACDRCPAASGAASRCAACCCRSPTCCCSTSRRTISTPSPSRGSSVSSRSIRARSSRSRTIATSSTTSQAGSSSSIAATASRGRATTARGSSRRTSGSRSRKSRKPRGSARSRPSSSGCARIPARGARRAKARLARFEELTSKEFQTRNETNEIYIPPGPRLGDLVIEADKIGKSFGDRVLFENLSFSLPPGGIVGVIGPNGAGKTTLFRMMAGQEKPDAGTIRAGNTVQLAYVDQSRDSLNNDKTVWDEISHGQDIMRIGTYETPSRAYVGRFNFRGTDQQKKVGLLSGGERNRVHLAKLLRSRRQPAAARRADQRPRRRDAARARRGAAELPRQRGRDLARSLVPRPHRDPHPRVRGQQRGRVLPGQLRRLRRGPQAAQGPGRRPAAPDSLQEDSTSATSHGGLLHSKERPARGDLCK